MKRKGFNLLELVVVVIILGVLAVLAANHFGIQREKGMAREALSQLRLVRAAERMYRLETGSFIACERPVVTGGANDCNTVLGLDLPTGNYDYNVALNGLAEFDAQADRAGGNWNTCRYSTTNAQLNPDVDPDAAVGPCPYDPR